MKLILGIVAAASMMVLAACSGSISTITHEAEYWIDPEDGKTKRARIRERTTGLEWSLEGTSWRDVINDSPVPFPRMDQQGSDHQIRYRYEYRCDIRDNAGNYVDTVSFRTFDEFVGLVPLMFELGGMDVPSQDVLDALVSQVDLVWVDPEVDWALNN